MRQEDFIPTIIAYENGKLTHEEIVEFFQYVIDSGLANRSQGRYRRTAEALIAAGHCRRQSGPFSVN